MINTADFGLSLTFLVKQQHFWLETPIFFVGVNDSPLEDPIIFKQIRKVEFWCVFLSFPSPWWAFVYIFEDAF